MSSSDPPKTTAAAQVDALSLGAAPTAPSTDPSQRYSVQQALGQGGLGEVQGARDRVLDREVAIKSLRVESNESLPEFWHEARVTAMLDHPAIVPVYDAGTLDGTRPYYTMKWVRGDNLQRLLEDRDAPGLRARLNLFVRVCDAIAYAHNKRWVHRDLKPSNIMVGDFGEVLVADWGLAWNLDSAELPRAAGTPAYMAPEQAMGIRQDERSDVFALGGILWNLLSGVDPWAGTDPDTIVAQLRRGKVFVPRGKPGPPELVAIAKKALTADPSGRYRQVTALRDDVVAWLDGEYVGAYRYSIATRMGRWGLRHGRLLALAAAMSAAAVVLLTVAGSMTGFAIWRSAQVSDAAAVRAAAAELQAKKQLIDALIANSAASLTSGQLLTAVDALERADQVGGSDALDLAWADATSRAIWPVNTFQIDESPVELRVRDGRVWIYAADGTWQAFHLGTGKPFDRGDVGGRVLALHQDNAIVERSGGLALVDGRGKELAQVALAAPDVRIERVFVRGDLLLVQAFEGGVAPQAEAWRLPELVPVDLPALGFVHEVDPTGSVALTSERRYPDRGLAGRVVSLEDGEVRVEFANDGLRVALLADHLVRFSVGEMFAVDYSGAELWRREGPVVLSGVQVPGGGVAMADEAGDIWWMDAATGAEQTAIAGLGERPNRVVSDDSGVWLVAAGQGGTVAAWALPQSPVVRLDIGAPYAAAHPEGRLLALMISEELILWDVPSATQVRRFPFPGEGLPRMAWSPDGLRLAIGGGPKGVILDVVTGEMTEVEPGFPVWTDQQLVLGSTEQIVRLDPVTLETREVLEGVGGGLWEATALPDGGAMFSANRRTDEIVGVRVPVEGDPVWLDGGGSTEHVGFGVGVLDDGRLAFARQDGRVVVRGVEGSEFETWTWQSGPLMDVVPSRLGLLTVGFEGWLHALDPQGGPVYSSPTDERVVLWATMAGDDFVYGGPNGIRVMPLDGRFSDDPQARVLAAHAWSLVDTEGLAAEQQLTVALGRGEGVEAALEGRDDATAALVSAALD